MSVQTPVLVVDTSVVAKWFLPPESDSDRARRLLERHAREAVTLCAPSLMIWELGNVLRYKPWLTPSLVGESLDTVIEVGIRLYDPSPSLIHRAVDISYQTGITVYDAAFVAIGDELACQLVTADERLASRVNSPSVQLLSQS